MADEFTIERAIKGDTQAFRSLFSLYENKVFRTAYFILRDRQYAEDVVQNTFLQVYLKIGKLSNTKAFEAWLYKITVTQCSSLTRKINKLNVVSMDEGLTELDMPMSKTFDMPENKAIQKDIQRIIMVSIYSLPVKHRTVLTLFYYNNMSIREIADILSCSEGTVKSRLFYSKQELKKILTIHGIDIDDYDKEATV